MAVKEKKPAPLIPVHLHPVRHQRVQRRHFPLAVADDLAVGVAPQEQVRHQRLPEHEGSHLRVRLIMEQEIQRMVRRLFLAPVPVMPVKLQRQPRHRLRQDPHARIHRRHLHRGPFRHILAARTAPQVKRERAPRRPVFRLVPAPEYPAQKSHKLFVLSHFF